MDEIKIKALIDAADSAKTIQELKKALRDLKSAAVEVGESSQYFEDITKAAGGVSDRIGDLNSQVKSLGDDLFKLRGVVQIGQGIAAGFSIAQGAAALFGAENSKLEETLVKLNSVMAMLNGLMAIGELLQKESTAVLLTQNIVRGVTVGLVGKETVAKAQLAVANGTATATQRALNAAMTANPAGILLAAITAIVGAYYLFSDSTEDLKKKNDQLNKSLEFTRELLDYQESMVVREIDNRKKLAESRGADAKEITNLEIEKLNAQEKYAKKRMAALKKEISSERKERQKAFDNGEDDLANDINARIEKKQEEFDKIEVSLKATAGYENQYALDRQVLLNKQTQKEKEENDKRVQNNKKSLDKKTQDAKSFVVDMKKINDVLYNNDIRLQEALLSTWGDTYDKKILQQLSAEEKSKKEVLDAQKGLIEELQNEYLKSKEFLDLKIEVTGIQDSKFQTAWANFLASNKAEAKKAQTALAEIEKSGQNAISAIQKQGSYTRQQIAKDEKDALAKIYKETAQVVLAQDEYRRFYEFLNIQIDKYANKVVENQDMMQKGNDKVIKTLEGQIKEQEELIAKKKQEIEVDKERSRINDEKNVMMLQMGQITQDALDDTRKLDAKNIENHNNAIKQAEEMIKQLKNDIEVRGDAKKSFDEFYKSVSDKSSKLKTSQIDINQKIIEFNDLLGYASAAFEDLNKKSFGNKQAAEFAKLAIEIGNVDDTMKDFRNAMDLFDMGFSLDFSSSQKSIMDTVKTLDEFPEEVQKAGDKLKIAGEKIVTTVGDTTYAISKEADGFTVGYTEFGDTIMENAKKIFDVNRDINKSQVADSLKASLLTIAIYKDKNDEILRQEGDITNMIRTEAAQRVDDANAILKAGVDEQGNILSEAQKTALQEIVKKNTEFTGMEFKINPIKATDFGLDVLSKEFGEQLKVLNEALKKRRDEAIKLEQAVYEEDLFALFKQLDAKEITQKEYDKKVEIARLNHEQNLLAIQVAYGEKGQQDFVQNSKERREFVRLEREKERNELFNHLNQMFELEKKAADLYMQWWMQENARQDRESQKRYDDQIALIDEEQKAYETSIANRTAAEQQQEDIKDEFALRRQQAEDQRKREQNDLAEKAFDAQKANTLAQMAIEYSLAIAKAWGTFGPFGLPMAGFLAAEGIIAAALVATQEFVPQYATGGLVTGPGGPKDDKINAKLSNGEAVINAKSTKMYAPLLSAINQAGGGVPIPSIGASKADEVMMMAEGGMVDNFQFSERKNTPIVHGWSQPVVVGLDYTTMRELGQIMASKDQNISIQENSISNAQDKKAKVDSRTKF